MTVAFVIPLPTPRAFSHTFLIELRPQIQRHHTRSLILTAEDKYRGQECDRYLREMLFHTYLHR